MSVCIPWPGLVLYSVCPPHADQSFKEERETTHAKTNQRMEDVPMTSTRRPFKVRRITSWPGLSVLAFSAIALISLPQAAVADPITYTLENVEAAFTAATENYTGTITLDQAYQVTSASISEFGTVDATLTYVTTSANSVISVNNGNDNILIAFENTFSNPENTIDPVFSIADMNLGKASDVTGAAYPPPPPQSLRLSPC